ncbi:hypothetical protein YB2330_003692 [Saitoella coloradoensis]
MAPSAVSRLTILADSTLLTLHERQRLLSLNVAPSPETDEEILKSLQTLQHGIDVLEEELGRAESDGKTSSTKLKEAEDVLIKLQSSYHTLKSMFDSPPDTEAPPLLNPPTLRTSRSPSPHSTSAKAAASLLGSDPREDLLGEPSRNQRERKQVRFSDHVFSNEDGEPNDNSTILALQNRIMESQDTSLDALAASLSTTRNLSLHISDELDSHQELLADLDDAVDRSRTRVEDARRRVRKIGRKVKGNWGCSVITLLICILVVLIVVLK